MIPARCMEGNYSGNQHSDEVTAGCFNLFVIDRWGSNFIRRYSKSCDVLKMETLESDVLIVLFWRSVC